MSCRELVNESKNWLALCEDSKMKSRRGPKNSGYLDDLRAAVMDVLALPYVGDILQEQ